MSAASNTVFLVDDEPPVVRALERLLRAEGYEVQGFLSSRAFLERHDPEIPGCAVFDIAIDGMNGLELQRFLTDSGCERPIVFLTGRGDIPMSVQAMQAGAVSFLTKPVDGEALLESVRLALERDRTAREARGRLAVIERRLASLTAREREVLEHVVSGRLNKQIAADLGTAEKTVKVHRGRVMEKMRARSVAELVRLSDQAGVAPVNGASGATQLP